MFYIINQKLYFLEYTHSKVGIYQDAALHSNFKLKKKSKFGIFSALRVATMNNYFQIYEC